MIKYPRTRHLSGLQPELAWREAGDVGATRPA
jgi:hypothetical protein